MEANKDTEAKVDYSDRKSYNFVGKKSCSRRTKIVIISILLVVLLLGAVIAVSVYFAMRKTTPTHLVEVKLEEGETLEYKVEQEIEIQGNDVQKATIQATVGIRVLNKTSEEYWFLMNFNLSYLDGNADLPYVKKENAHFLVHLQIFSRTQNSTESQLSESFEVYGKSHTTEEFLRLVYNILKQLLPTVQHDLYEDVDGEKPDSLVPEESPLLPGPVKMHRKADTTNKSSVSIKNHFSREDFQDLPTEIDLDLKYSDHAVIDKNKGVIKESHSNFTQQLNFGEPIIHSQGGLNVSMMKITLMSHISLVEIKAFTDTKNMSFQFFVKLVVPKSRATFSVHEKSNRVSGNPSQTPLNVSSPSRSRRAAAIEVPWQQAGTPNLNFEHPFTLFEKKVIGIDVKAEGMVWLHRSQDEMEMGVRFGLKIGSKKLTVFHKNYERSELEDEDATPINHEWSVGIPCSIRFLILRVGVEFSLTFDVSIQRNFPMEQNSLNPVNLAVEIDPSAGATVSIEGYVSAHIIRGGVYGDGTLVRVGLPVTLSYQENRSPGSQWCTSLSVHLTALELSAGAFYQKRHWRHWWHWGKKHTLYEFGKWDAIQRSWKELERCG